MRTVFIRESVIIRKHIQYITQAADIAPMEYNKSTAVYSSNIETARENPSQFDLARGYALGVEYTIELIKHSLEKKR